MASGQCVYDYDLLLLIDMHSDLQRGIAYAGNNVKPPSPPPEQQVHTHTHTHTCTVIDLLTTCRNQNGTLAWHTFPTMWDGSEFML